jgi:hypothetical protein
MNDLVKKIVLGITTVGALLGASTHDAHAWLKFKNSTNTTVNIAHAFDSRSTDLCGWSDSCFIESDIRRFRVKYYWVLAPGAESTVNSNDFENALHEFYAFGVNGLVWEGGGNTFRIKSTEAGNHCGWTGGLTVDKVFRKLNTSRCCGIFDCAGGDPADKRVQLTQ